MTLILLAVSFRASVLVKGYDLSPWCGLNETDIVRGETDNGDGRRSNGDRHPGVSKFQLAASWNAEYTLNIMDPSPNKGIDNGPCCHSRESGNPGWVPACAGMTTGEASA